MLLKIVTSAFLLSFFVCTCNGSPLTDDEWLAEVDDIPVEPKVKEPRAIKANTDSKDEATHLMQMEHKGNSDAPVKTAFKSIGLGAVDSVVSGVVTLAGGVVENLGDLVVATVNQLPSTIKSVSEMVGTAVDLKRDKVNLVAKTVGMTEPVDAVAQEATKKAFQVLDHSRIRDSFGKLEEAFGSLLGKLIAVSFKNAGEINTAFSDGISRIANTNRTRLQPPLFPIFRTRIVKVLDGRDKHPLSYQKTKIAKFIEAETGSENTPTEDEEKLSST